MKRQQLNTSLILGDVIALLVFALAGLSSHERNPSLTSLLRVTLPFLSAWLPIAYAMGLYRRGDVAPSNVWTGVLKAWLPAWAAGLLIRSLVFGRAFSPSFAIIAFIANIVLLAGWRAGYAYQTRNRSARRV